jgi:hypothetical protein
MSYLHIRDHSLLICALAFGDDTKEARIGYCYALEVAVFAYYVVSTPSCLSFPDV